AGEHGTHYRYRRMRRHGAALCSKLTQRATSDQLHDEIDRIAFSGEVIDIHQIRMRQLRHSACFAAETVNKDRVLAVLVMHDLRGQCASKAQIHTAVHSGHAAASNWSINSIPVLEDVSYFQLCHGI